MTSGGGGVRERGVDRVEHAVARAGVVGRAGLERISGAGLAQRLGEQARTAPTAPPSSGRAGRWRPRQARRRRTASREPGLADAGLAGQRREPTVRGALCTRTMTRAGARARRGGRRTRSRVRAAGLVVARRAGSACAATRRGARGSRATAVSERATQALTEPVARGQRGGAVARAREPLDQAPVRLLRERVECDLFAREADRLGGSRSRPAARGPRRAAARAPDGRRRPSRRRSRRGSRAPLAASAVGASPASRAAANARVSTEPSSATVSRRLAGGRRPAPARRAARSARRAGLRGPTRRGRRAERAASWARASAWMQRQVMRAPRGRGATWAARARRRWREAPALRSVGPPARANCVPTQDAAQGVRLTFTVRERNANRRPGTSVPCPATFASSPAPSASPRSATSSAVFPLVLHVQQRTGSAFAVSALVFALWGPVVLAAGLAARSSTASRTASLLIVVSFAQAAVVAGMVAGADELWAILPLMALLGFGVAVSQPAEFALVPAAAGRTPTPRAPTG